MCNEREKLIGYLYDECDPSERAAVQRHLDGCGECRTEIASLRSVREDLTAWDVPEHGSVWKPFTPTSEPRWWQHVPQWALAAAAGIVLMSGATGGAITHAFMPHEAPVATPVGATQVTDARELAALQQQIATLRAELAQVNQRVEQTKAPAITPEMEAALHRTFDRQLSELRTQSEKSWTSVVSLYNDFTGFKSTTRFNINKVKSDLDSLATAVGARASGGQQ